MKTTTLYKLFTVIAASAGCLSLCQTALADKDHKAKVKEARNTSEVVVVDPEPDYDVVPVPKSEAVTYKTIEMPLTESQKAKFRANLAQGILKPVNRKEIVVPERVDQTDKVITPMNFRWNSARVVLQQEE